MKKQTVQAVVLPNPYVGTVTLVDVSGNAPGSAELLFTVESGDISCTFVASGYLDAKGTPSQTFAPFTSIVTAAFVSKKPVAVRWVIRNPRETPTAMEIGMRAVTDAVSPKPRPKKK